MRTKVSFSWQALAVALTAVGMVSCSDTKNVMTDMPVIAERVQLPTGDLIACDLSKANDTVDIPLSLLTEELQVVKLDNRDELLVRMGENHCVRQLYIGEQQQAGSL